MDSANLTTWVDQAQPILAAFSLKVIGPGAFSSLASVEFYHDGAKHYFGGCHSGHFKFENTTFAVLVAGASVAVEVAWSDMPGNFVVGIFLLILRP